MLRALLEKTRNKTVDLACVAGGMGAILVPGGKLIGLALFAKGFWGLERRWRDERGFEGPWSERMQRSAEFYEGTHTDPTNRMLHRVGIPMIVGGAALLLAFPALTPLWIAGVSLFVFGWVLNFIGHGLYEKNAPAFADDPLSFLAGPLWDLRQLRGARAQPDVVDVTPRPAREPEPVGAAS